MVILEALVWLVVEPIFVVQCGFFVLYVSFFAVKYHKFDQR